MEINIYLSIYLVPPHHEDLIMNWIIWSQKVTFLELTPFFVFQWAIKHCSVSNCSYLEFSTWYEYSLGQVLQ